MIEGSYAATRYSLLATSTNEHPRVGRFVPRGGDIEPGIEPAGFVARRRFGGSDELRCGGKRFGEERLRAILAEAENFHRSGEQRGNVGIIKTGDRKSTRLNS